MASLCRGVGTRYSRASSRCYARLSIFSIGKSKDLASVPFTVDDRESRIPPRVMERRMARRARSFFLKESVDHDLWLGFAQ